MSTGPSQSENGRESDNEYDNASDEPADESIAGEEAPTRDEDLDTGLLDDTFNVKEVIAPVAPKASLAQEILNEVSSSPAFQCLDELLQQGKITATKVAHFKTKYQHMHDLLKAARDNEVKLIQHAKEATAQVEHDKAQLEDSADKFPENAATTETGKLRITLLKYNNDLAQTEDANYHLAYKIENLEEERNIIKREYDRLPKQEALEKRVRDLQVTTEDLKREILQRQTDLKSLREDLEVHRRQQETQQKENDGYVEKLEELKQDYLVACQIPQDIQRDVDRIQRHKAEAEKEYSDIHQNTQNQIDTLRKYEQKRKQLEDQKNEAERELDKRRSNLSEFERELELWQKEYEMIKERETVLLGDKATLDVQIKHMQAERRHLHEIFVRQQHERDGELHELRKAEIQLKAVRDGLRTAEESFKRSKQAMSLLPPTGSYVSERNSLTNECKDMRSTLGKQQSETAAAQAEVETSLRDEERLLHDQKTLRILVVELTRLAAIKADEREQKARDFIRAEQRHKKALEEFRMKGIIIEDHKKKLALLQFKLEEYSGFYTTVKNERNKSVNQIQVAVQKLSEMREKLKVLQNEIEILRSTIRNKEKILQKEKLKHINEIVIRDSVRAERGKAQVTIKLLTAENNQQKLQLSQLKELTTRAEDAMIALRKQYEKEVQYRNQRGVELIERNEEICVFYERLNAQTAASKRAEVELSARVEEASLLELRVKEEARKIDLLRKRSLEHSRYNGQVVTLQIQLSQCQDHLSGLEKRASEPGIDLNRYRYLEGPLPDAGSLKDKSDQLEKRLTEKEEQSFEKQLLLDQLERLIERLDNRTGGTRDDTLRLAKTVNEYSGRLRKVTRKLMAVVSELSMRQAESLKLSSEVNEKETLLQECYQRMERGEPPTQEIAIAWEKEMLAEERRRAWGSEGSQMANYGPQLYGLQTGGYTSAEPRPNAYVPTEDTGELPVPKPYGSQAPFKPQAPGSNMRHIRKPVPKPIEI